MSWSKAMYTFRPNLLWLIVLVTVSCVEEINLQSEIDFESVLVVEAEITNEHKRQIIKLSRSFRLEEEGPVPENGASVQVVLSDGRVYQFIGGLDGIYRSSVEFAAEPNIGYKLNIITNNGLQYTSAIAELTPSIPIEEVRAERSFNENNDEGVSIFVSTDKASTDSNFFRYEYDETYKVIAPSYAPMELIAQVPSTIFPFNIQDEFAGFTTLSDVIDFFVVLDFRPEQEQICYNTVKSNTLILTSSQELSENNIDTFRVRFLNRDNYIISHRYSILVRQYVQSLEAHLFYKTLRDFSLSESIFSETQVGFLQGNIASVNSTEKVAGFFEVASVDSKRIYFNYEDLFAGEDLPPYFINCDDFLNPILLEDDGDGNAVRSELIEHLELGFQFFNENDYTDEDSPFTTAPFTTVLGPCGDCTVLGDNTVPNFWVE